MKQEKAQSQIITTVLIILLVIAATVIVWQIIQNTVTEGMEQVESSTQCANVKMKISKAQAGTNEITIMREAGDRSILATEYKILINGESIGSKKINMEPLDTDTYELSETNLSSGDQIKVAGFIGNTACTESAPYTVE